MTTLIIIIFFIGYVAIALEHSIKLNKAASALITGVLCWLVYTYSVEDKEMVVEKLLSHLSEISSILFFLLGVMTIVELIDTHSGFNIIVEKIKTKSKLKLLWLITIITFFLSAFLDNLTTAIIMTSLTAKILSDKNDRMWFTSMIIIAANAGGVFSPLGDVTTTMLWIGKQITVQNIITKLFIPSIFVCLVPLLIISKKFYNKTIVYKEQTIEFTVKRQEANIVLIVGVLLLILVPLFKVITHLPPFMGILLALGIFWIIVSIINAKKTNEETKKLTVKYALEKIDIPSILFFLGILLAVSALQSLGILKLFATYLDKSIGNMYIIGTTLGVISSIVDNVPLVAAAQGMYDLQTYPTNHLFWEFIALTTGTGGSMIIIGSAAGVAAMGIEKIDFLWYFKKISWIALVGFIAGIVVYIIQAKIF